MLHCCFLPPTQAWGVPNVNPMVPDGSTRTVKTCKNHPQPFKVVFLEFLCILFTSVKLHRQSSPFVQVHTDHLSTLFECPKHPPSDQAPPLRVHVRQIGAMRQQAPQHRQVSLGGRVQRSRVVAFGGSAAGGEWRSRDLQEFTQCKACGAIKRYPGTPGTSYMF